MKRYIVVLLIGILTASTMMGQVTGGGEEPEFDAFIFVDEEPKPLNMAEIQAEIGYPEAAVDSNFQGQVIMRVLVDESGNYLKHKVVKGIHPLLSDAVAAQIVDLTFSPAMHGGKALKFWVNIPFNFRMVEKDAETVRREQIEELNKQIAADPTNYQALLTRGIAYRELDQLENAIADFEESLAANPRVNKKKSTTFPYVFFAHFARGTSFSLKEEWVSAIEDFDAAFEIYEEMKMEDTLVTGTLAKVYLERGFARFQEERYEDADADYSQVINLDPDQACDVYSLKSELNLARENFTGVVSAMGHLIECQPDDPYLHYSRGYYKMKTESYESAIEDFLYTVENNSNPLFQIAALNQAALSYMEMGNMEKANSTIDQAMQMNVLNPPTYYYRGLIHEGAGKVAEACSDMTKSIDYGLEGDELKKAEDFIMVNCSKPNE